MTPKETAEVILIVIKRIAQWLIVAMLAFALLLGVLVGGLHARDW